MPTGRARLWGSRPVGQFDFNSHRALTERVRTHRIIALSNRRAVASMRLAGMRAPGCPAHPMSGSGCGADAGQRASMEVVPDVPADLLSSGARGHAREGARGRACGRPRPHTGPACPPGRPPGRPGAAARPAPGGFPERAAVRPLSGRRKAAP
jgi:hypothetical protein